MAVLSPTSQIKYPVLFCLSNSTGLCPHETLAMNQPPPDQPRLAAAYYGPPIYTYPPPPPPPPYRDRRLLTIAIRAFITFCVAFGLAILILWLVFRPQRMKIAVSTASLSRFNLTSTSSGDRLLSFNLSTNLTFRNPNKRVGIYYDWLEAHANYDGMRFGWAGLPVFYQGRKETTEVTAEFDGRSAIGIGRDEQSEFDRDNAAGVFPVDLWIFGRVRYKFGDAVTRRYILRALCPLRLPLGKGGFSFTDCNVLNP